MPFIRDILGPVELFTDLDQYTNGMIFEFKHIVQAEAFVDEVKCRFHLEGRVFDNAEAAYRAHLYPFVQTPPVAHIDRPYWKLDEKALKNKKKWNAAFKIEERIVKLAEELGGYILGT